MYIDLYTNSIWLSLYSEKVNTELFVSRPILRRRMLILSISPEGHTTILITAHHAYAVDTYVKWTRCSCHLSLGI